MGVLDLGFRVCQGSAHRHAGRLLWCAPTLSAPPQPAHPHLTLGEFRVSFNNVSGSSQPSLTCMPKLHRATKEGWNQAAGEQTLVVVRRLQRQSRCANGLFTLRSAYDRQAHSWKCCSLDDRALANQQEQRYHPFPVRKYATWNSLRADCILLGDRSSCAFLILQYA